MYLHMFATARHVMSRKGGTVTLDALPPTPPDSWHTADEPPRRQERIRASWTRCAERGLAVDLLRVPFRADIDDESPLVRCASPVLAALRSTLANEPIAILLSDRSGLVLSRECDDPAFVKALDDVTLTPGATYSEEAVGTNGFGLALADDRVSLVASQDHYNSSLRDYTCAGAPIHDPVDGRIVGALSLTVWSSTPDDLLPALAAQTAMNIEAQFTGRSGAGHGCDRLKHRLTRIETLERDAIQEALTRTGGDVGGAAADLGISRATVYRRIKYYGIRKMRESL
ncbi:helix-turn-helix domain-containing protein [Streptomyces sp. CRN 30]|uniref:helix-turn-helix domain-containing protein n=1 Tax=Streptomyces sp. CRN 30 TaxID=3075613 RepID=UPI002A818DB5|nr:helix-turn-helix domain-containing protein [Streptomyces sp. CRN 30]